MCLLSHTPGSINAEYKSKLRSLAFNLRDPHNPDLRAHVLMGEILPRALVTMSPADLANKDLAEWRRKVEEEHNKAIELDVEAAAKVIMRQGRGGRRGREGRRVGWPDRTGAVRGWMGTGTLGVSCRDQRTTLHTSMVFV